MRLLICGDRNWTDYEAVKSAVGAMVAKYGKDIIVVEGEARGADTLGRKAAEHFGLVVEKYPADWERYGKGAGPIRNRQMLDTGIDWVMGFHKNIFASKGTRHMLRLAASRGVPTRHWDGIQWNTWKLWMRCPDCEFFGRDCQYHRYN